MALAAKGKIQHTVEQVGFDRINDGLGPTDRGRFFWSSDRRRSSSVPTRAAIYEIGHNRSHL
jgi:hypothetical protein